MKQKLLLFFIPSVVAVFLYLCISLLIDEFNIDFWSESARSVWLVMWVASSLVASIIYLYNQDKKEL